MSIGESPVKGSDKYIWAGLDTDTKPSTAFIGQQCIETNTGLVFEWDGINWCPRIDGVEIDTLVKSIPTTSTFHHLGHEGKVFIHSERHDNLASGGGILDMIIRIPAGNPDRQVHFRFNAKAKADTGTLDVDVILYEGTTVSVSGAPEIAVSTNDAVVLTTGVELYADEVVSDEGNFKGQGAMLGENKSTGNQDMAVPEFVMAPNGASSRDYLIRTRNNGSGTADIIHNLFWYDSEAE